MKKFMMAIISSFFIFNMVSCDVIKDTEPTNLFNVDDAKSLAGDYMESLSKGDIDSANGYSKEKFILESEAEKLKENTIISYKVDSVTEGSEFAYIKYLVVRSRNDSIKTSLDTIELKVVKDGEGYYVTSANTKGEKEVYEDGSNLRVIDEKLGKSSLLLRKKDLPQEVYPKSDDENILTKEEVSGGNFSKVNIGFQGVNVAMALNDNKGVFIAIAQIDESQGNSGSSKSEGDDYIAIGENLESALEKPVAKNIKGYDLLRNTQIQKLLFTDDDGYLIAQLSNGNGVSFVRIYKNPDGDLLALDLEEIFSKDKYSVEIEKVTSDGVYINSKPISEDTEHEGVFIIDCKNMKITRKEES